MSTSLQAPDPVTPPQNFHFKYTVLKGYFLQSESSTDDEIFDFKKENFGLIDRSYDMDSPGDDEQLWRRFDRHIRHLNAEAQKQGESIKLLFLARHGQGWHNVAQAQYDTAAWDCYYSALNGSGTMTWSDAHLTPLGTQQALAVHTLWSTLLPLGLPSPETHYVSPLTRTLQTADLTFQHLRLPDAAHPYTPLVKELLREALGVHTCDRRSARSAIAAAFPHARFEPGFSEADELWDAGYREPRRARRYRLARLLDDVFAADGGVVLSLTAHAGAIKSLLEVVGHRAFALETGAVVPVVVRARKVAGSRRVPEWEPSAGPPLSAEPPV